MNSSITFLKTDLKCQRSNLRCLSCRSVWTSFLKSCLTSWRHKGWVFLFGTFCGTIRISHGAGKLCVGMLRTSFDTRQLTALAVTDWLVLFFRKWLRPHRGRSRPSCRTLSKSEFQPHFCSLNRINVIETFRLSIKSLPCVSARH